MSSSIRREAWATSDRTEPCPARRVAFDRPGRSPFKQPQAIPKVARGRILGYRGYAGHSGGAQRPSSAASSSRPSSSLSTCTGEANLTSTIPAMSVVRSTVRSISPPSRSMSRSRTGRNNGHHHRGYRQQHNDAPHRTPPYQQGGTRQHRRTT